DAQSVASGISARLPDAAQAPHPAYILPVDRRPDKTRKASHRASAHGYRMRHKCLTQPTFCP
ncbi:hypothetical protein RCM39_00795, partial [Escherichia marmotae]|nr:hypothetical protein [Escherichia marmotae]